MLRKAARPELVEYAFTPQGHLAAAAANAPRHHPAISIVHVEGELFFGAAELFRTQIQRLASDTNLRVIILRMRYVPHIDATGLNALREFHRRCVKHGTTLLLGGVHAHPLFEMVKAGMDREIGLEYFFDNLDDALDKAREIVGIDVPATSPQSAA